MAHQFKLAGYAIFLRKRLGRGAFGTVYKALDSNGCTVAAKEIDKDHNSRGALREIDNANKQRKLNHENIVKILDVNNEEDEMWMFLEYCDGGDLNTYSRNHFQELKNNQLRVMKETAKGLHFLHKLRIAHRDIKPENILIQTKSGSPQVKLTDFGVSKFHSEDATCSAMHTNLGTHTYKAPEFWNVDQEDGSITYYKNVDVYALGLTYLAILQAK